MKVAMIGLRAPWGAVGGVETAVAELAPRLVEQGVDVSVYCRTRYNELGEGMHRGVKLVNHQTIYTKHLEAIVHTAHALPAAIKNADIVHIHATGPAILSWLPRLFGRRTVVTIHAFDHERSKWGWLARQVLRTGLWIALRFPHQRLVVGKHLQAQIKEDTGISTVCVPNAPSKLDPAPLSDGNVEAISEGNYILYLGRLVPEKNLEHVFEAYMDSGINIPFVVVGDNANMPHYIEHLKSIAPTGVLMVGARYGQAKSALLQHARAFVLPSSIEGFPISVLEAMSVACLCLLSDIAPHQEILSMPDCGVLVKDDAWIDTFRWLERASLEERTTLSINGQRHVNDNYSWDRAAKETIAVYQNLMGEL